MRYHNQSPHRPHDPHDTPFCAAEGAACAASAAAPEVDRGSKEASYGVLVADLETGLAHAADAARAGLAAGPRTDACLGASWVHCPEAIAEHTSARDRLDKNSGNLLPASPAFPTDPYALLAGTGRSHSPATSGTERGSPVTEVPAIQGASAMTGHRTVRSASRQRSGLVARGGTRGSVLEILDRGNAD